MLDMSEQTTDFTVENTVFVKIWGTEYPISGYTDPAHITKVAEYVDARMCDIAQCSRTKARDKVAILAALSIASELLDSRDRQSDVGQGVDYRLGELLSRLDAALADPNSHAS